MNDTLEVFLHDLTHFYGDDKFCNYVSLKFLGLSMTTYPSQSLILAIFLKLREMAEKEI